ncbi:methylenetetrahydrofolate reductase [Candidatus Hodgkinia cicadicola]
MANVIQCLYGLYNVDISFSVEFFPPKHWHALRCVASEYSLATHLIKFKFVSLTCGASGADKHNSYKLLLALSLILATPKVLVHIIQVDKSATNFYTLVQALKRLGVNKILLLKGDYYISSQIRPDAVKNFLVLRRIRKLGLFCAATNYPEVHSSGISARCERALATIKSVLGCSYSFTQFFNVTTNFVKSSVRACLLSNLWNVPGFVVSVKRPLGCRTSVKCSVYIHGFVKKLVLTDCRRAWKRTMIIYTITKVYTMLANNVRWLHVFALNRFRAICKLAWLLSIRESLVNGNIYCERTPITWTKSWHSSAYYHIVSNSRSELRTRGTHSQCMCDIHEESLGPYKRVL